MSLGIFKPKYSHLMRAIKSYCGNEKILVFIGSYIES